MTAQDLINAAFRAAKRSGLYDTNDREACEFELAEAVHAYASVNHGGQGSELYEILSTSEFVPGPMWKERHVMESEAYDIVERVAKRKKLK